jgi:putative ABC transport system permease protein
MTELFAQFRDHYQEIIYASLAGFAFLMVLFVLLGKVPAGYNVRNLMVRWKTTLMTALAFTLVVALMTAMLAFVRGMYQLTVESGQPGNVMVLANGATDEFFSTLNATDTGDIERQPGVRRDPDGSWWCSKEVLVIVNQPIAVAPGEKPRRRFVQVRGVEDPAVSGKVHGLKLQPGGQWFSEAGVREAGAGTEDSPGPVYIEAVLGSGIAGEIGKDRPVKKPLAVGDTFPLGSRIWVVAGILDSAGSTFDSEVWGKRSFVGDEFGKKNSYSSYVLRAEGDGKNLEANAKQLAESLKTYKGASLNAQPEKEYFQRLGETSMQFLYAIVAVAVVMAVGGAFGVMNTMFAAISQRIKDIGVLRILGYSRRHVLMSFLLESLVLALVGGLLGCAIGYLANGWTAKSVVGGGQGGAKSIVLKLVVTHDILAAGLLLSLVMGAVGGLLPAVSAMRMRALESLR